ncbi:MAG: AAA family ATPase [Candidatus Omnitrophica bacterium]|nr:AAA family ATPase [Candidatus Omnitrophota bacterium]
MQEYEVTLSEYWRIIRKQKWTIVRVFIIVFLSVIVFTKLQKPIYQASLELRIERPQVGLIAGQGGVIKQEDSQNLATEILMLKSLPILRKVAEKIEVLPPESEERDTALHALSMQYQKNLIIEQIPNTNIVRITTESNDPQKAALMAKAIADVYIVENVSGRKKQSESVLSYINMQLDKYKDELEKEEVKLQKFSQNEKVFEVTPKIKEVLDRMTIQGTFEFETQMLEIETNLKKIDDQLKSQNATLFETTIDKALSENYIFVGLKRRLLELEFDRFLLLIDYTEKHPEVIAKDKIISGVKQKIVDMIKNFSNVKITPEQEAQLSLSLKKLFLDTQREVLYRIVNRFYGDSGSLSSNQLEYVRLKRNVDRLVTSYDELLNKQSDAKLEQAKVIDDVVTVVSPADVPKIPFRPNIRMNYLMGIALGFLLGLFFAFIGESLDSSISSISDIEKVLNLNILGIIPHIKKEEIWSDKELGLHLNEKEQKILLQQARLVAITSPKSWPAETIKMLRTKIIQYNKIHGYKTFLFTSSDKQEGKSTLVMNLALSLAQLGKKTLLLGNNLRRPTIYKTFGLHRSPGLTDVLIGNITWKEAVNTATDILVGGVNVDDLLRMPGLNNLNILTSGRAVDNVSEILTSPQYDKLLNELKNYYEIIIVDCSPVMAVPDAVTLADRVDAVMLVYKVGHTSKDVLNMAKTNLLNAGANLLGVILNNMKTEAQVGYSAYYYRYYSETGNKPEPNKNTGQTFNL